MLTSHLTFDLVHVYHVNSPGEGPRDLQVMGRKLTLQKTCGKLLDVTFNDLCMKVGLSY